jgi:hypothetical protein
MRLGYVRPGQLNAKYDSHGASFAIRSFKQSGLTRGSHVFVKTGDRFDLTLRGAGQGAVGHIVRNAGGVQQLRITERFADPNKKASEMAVEVNNVRLVPPSTVSRSGDLTFIETLYDLSRVDGRCFVDIGTMNPSDGVSIGKMRGMNPYVDLVHLSVAPEVHGLDRLTDAFRR